MSAIGSADLDRGQLRVQARAAHPAHYSAECVMLYHRPETLELQVICRAASEIPYEEHVILVAFSFSASSEKRM